MHPFRQVDYPSSTFFNLTFATSLLVPLSGLLYAIFKWDTMLSDVPRWRNRFADLIFNNFGQGDDILAEQSYHTSSQVSHPCHWDLGGRSSYADHPGKVHWSDHNLDCHKLLSFLKGNLPITASLLWYRMVAFHNLLAAPNFCAPLPTKLLRRDL